MSKRKQFRLSDEQEEFEALLALEEQEQQRDPLEETLDSFFADGLITEIIHVVKSGKEATVYCCRAHPSQGVPYLAAKVYRSRNNRGFKNDSVYQDGRVVTDQHLRRAIKNKSRVGRDGQFAMWVGHEFATLTVLHAAGATTPRPIAQSSHAILMEYLGAEQEPAAALQHVTLAPHEVYPVFELLMDNIELWLSKNIIHGDLSPYNILYWQGQITVIDFPQAVDPRFNSHAYTLLERDIDNICKYVARYGLQRDATQLARRLWQQFRNARL
ncbi:RIO1 family regulatory kinase/ATPase domain-containing protein [Dictyobacter arantiisoli]|uniref:non-specific serine/threonine protein kinase n=1 Tax=Dictyobacter arantiisoli TaxID=2014874 RepID=A0A5A5TBT4_9CHLR|nr:RIO1 family regulatory kinase/ATPase [Dictyobacter arantiisoli]GCF08892.1 serine protein kinase RIO [Dictyobacter arantiisoli]